MPKTKWFYFLYSVIFILLILYLGTQVSFLFRPIGQAIGALAPVLIIGTILYYILRPLVRLLDKWLPTSLSIILIFSLFAGGFSAFIIWVGPILQNQVNNLVENVPSYTENVQGWAQQMMQHPYVQRIRSEEAFQSLDPGSIADNFSNYVGSLGDNILGFIGALFSIITVLVILPFVLFFLLKDGHKLPGNILRFLPKEQSKEGKQILQDMDHTLSSYIQGQAIVSVCVGILSLIAYLIIGLDYPLILAMVAMFTNLIPFIGPFIGTIPAVIVALFDSPLTAFWVIVAILVIQQTESNFISPNVMGKALAIHPLTIILLLLLAGNVAGLVGLILCIPIYAVSKVIVQNIYRLLRLRYPQIP
ncbi:AI-2E family transporter [Alteribacillus iranensis]|uniref:Predicted PurR-regulated permease PerM n=1 Tax=Alteribacillus iranensis TaxID=930128 RepID=A0A1I2EXM2_9BACI|nr:AI-2E family transporter [Alteribacillus iranensis]SFE97529.1 Predicted PurR-regulated permease PerM [Alteribacillus iranensis]